MICALVVTKFCSTNWVKRGLWFGLGRFFIAKTHARGTGENTGSKRCQRDEFPWWRVTLCLSNTCCIVLIPIRWYLKSAWNKFVCNVFPKQGLICSFSCSTNSALGAVKFHFNTWKKGNEEEKRFLSRTVSIKRFKTFSREGHESYVENWIILTLRSFSSLNRPSLPLCLKRGGPSISASAEDFLDDCSDKINLFVMIDNQILQTYTTRHVWRPVRSTCLSRFHAGFGTVAKYCDLRTNFWTLN